jgi:hypothetical protein
MTGKLSIIAAALLAVVVARADELQPMKFNNPGLTVDLGVGLWAIPMPMDYDGDGDLDLVIVSCGKPHNGTYFFENTQGKTKMPVFKPAVRIGAGRLNTQFSTVNGEPRVLRLGEEYVDFRKNKYDKRKKLDVDPKAIHAAEGRIRDNQWRYVDYDGDGAVDIIVGIGDWTDYGWDDAFDASGKWTNGPLHGFVYLLHNTGTTAKPTYAPATKVEADGKPIDVFGMPSPCFADFDGDGDLDLVCGEFVDKLTYFENVGTRTAPKYAAGKYLSRDGNPIQLQSCMINPVACDWDGDGDQDLLVGQEDGRVVFIENTGKKADGAPLFEAPKFFQQQADELKFGVLVNPIATDWDDDGDLDMVCGDAAGYIGYFENLDGANSPKWAAPTHLSAGGEEIRILAGPNGSIQGPAEAKWGYTTLSVADWVCDGLKDIVANSIWGKVVWYRNIGTKGHPKLDRAQPIEVAWKSGATKPAWLWWNPSGNDLVTQWRTTPIVADVTGDGLSDLVMLDRDGYLSLFKREKIDGKLQLLPPVHAFKMQAGTPSVFDNNNGSTTFDTNKDGVNDLAGLDSSGRVAFATMNPQGTREVVVNKFADRAGDPAYENPTSDPALRLTSGWAGRSGRRKLSLVDWDGDGKLDLLVNSQNVTFLKNVAEKPGEFVFKDMGLLDTAVLAGHDTAPATADFDRDGVPDLIVGAEDGFIYFMKNPRSKSAGK